MGLLRAWFGIKLWARVLAALGLGVVVGILWGEGAESIKWIGDLFLAAIRMLVVPLVFFTLTSGIIAMRSPAVLGRQGVKAFGIYLATTAFAITIGITFGLIFQPGVGLDISLAEAPPQPDPITITERLLSLVPENPVAALAEGDVLQIIVFSVLFGIGILLAGDKAKPIGDGIEAGAEVMYKITHIVMELAPFGVFALIAWVAGTQDAEVILGLAKLVAALYLACLLHIFGTYAFLIRVVAGLPLVRFFRGIFDAQAVAYSTASSSATLPVTMANVRGNLGVSNEVSGFVLPLGATINMDGTALYLGLAALFTAQAFGIDLSIGDYALLVLTATLVSIGAAGVPGASLIMMGIIFQPLGLPLEAIGIIAGVDRILDMMRTATNVTGDATVSVLVAKTENEIDEAVFRSPATA